MKKTLLHWIVFSGFAVGAVLSSVGDVALQEALDNSVLEFSTGGAELWYPDIEFAKKGATSLRSGEIGDDQETWVRTVVKGAGTLTFSWRVSSESVDYDWLEVSVDGDVVDKIGGTDMTDWSEVSIPISGSGLHFVKWRYRKDGSSDGGKDCGCLDNVVWNGLTPSETDKLSIRFSLNGGYWLFEEPVVYKGDKAADFPVPERDGELSFAGWFFDAALSRAVPADEPIPDDTVALYAKWAYPITILSTANCAFETSSPWYVEPGIGAGGDFAGVCALDYDYHPLRAKVFESGILTFKWKRVPATPSGELYLNSNTSYSYSYDAHGARTDADGWQEDSADVILLEWDSDRTVEWYAYRNSASACDILISDVQWTPAPDYMTVWFDPNDGSSAASSADCAPGMLFADIQPANPVRSGYAFAGWYLDSALTKRMGPYDYVPLHDVTLHAKWVKSVSGLNGNGIEFFSEGNTWGAAEDGSRTAVCDANSRNENDLLLSVTGPGTLGLTWRVNCPRGVYSSLEASVSSRAGSCRQYAVDIQPSPKPQAVCLKREYDPERKEYGPNSVSYFKVTLTHGQAYTAWLAGDDADLMSVEIVPDSDSEGAVSVAFDGPTWIGSGEDIQVWHLDEDAWSEEDPQTVDFIICVKGYGSRAWLGVQRGHVEEHEIEPWAAQPVPREEDGEKSFNWNGSGQQRESIEVYVSGPAVIDLTAYASVPFDLSSSSLRFELFDFTWTSAPDITVTYDVNGGEPMDPETYSPGLTYGELPTPSRDGYEFVGWYRTDEFGRETKVSSKDHLPLVPALSLKAKWGYSIDELNGGGLEFWNEGEDIWFAFPDERAENGVAAFAEVAGTRSMGMESTEDGATLVTAVSGYGTLSFRWAADEDEFSGAGEFYCLVDGSSDWWGNSTEWMMAKWALGDAFDGWIPVSIPVCGEDPHEIVWCLKNRSSASVRRGICDVTWTPAPEDIEVVLDPADGRTMDGRHYKPGDAYGELPVLTRAGETFLGWHVGEPGGPEVKAEDLVPFAGVRLVAKWARPISAMNVSGMTFATAGVDPFRLTNVPTPSGALAAEARPSTMPTSYSPNPVATASSVLGTVVTGPCYLTFEWGCMSENGSYGFGTFLVDGKVQEEIGTYNGWKTERIYIDAGKHKLQWIGNGEPATVYGGGACGEPGERRVVGISSLYVGGIRREAAGHQATIADWATKYTKFGVWSVGDMTRFKTAYAARIKKNPADYEARVFHAAALLGELAENATFKTFAKNFGYAVDYAHCSFVGKPKLTAKSPQVNAMVDAAIKVAVPVVQAAIRDLSAIPDGWSGAVQLSAKTWPIDEDVAIDLGDVRYAIASLDAAIGTLYFLGGYDLTVDWAKGRTEFEAFLPMTPFATIPDMGDEASWSRASRSRIESDDAGLLTDVRAVRVGNAVALRLLASDNWDDLIALGGLYAEIHADDDTWCSVNVDFYGTEPSCTYWSSAMTMADYETEHQLPFALDVRDNEILLVLNLSSVKEMKGKQWQMSEGEVFGESGGVYIRSGWHRHDQSAAAIQRALGEQLKFFSKVRNAKSLALAKTWVKQALQMALQADGGVRTRSDDSVLHFIEYDPAEMGKIETLRETTAQAVRALDSRTEVFDMTAILDGLGLAEDFNCSLLPNDGLVTVYLGALFSGKITRAMLPPTHLDDCGDMVGELARAKDPTFGGVLPEMTRAHLANIASNYLESGEESPIVSHPLVPGEKVVISCTRYIGYAVSGLPKGWTWNRTTGLLSGTVTSSFNLTFALNGAKAVETVTVGPKPALIVRADLEHGVGVKAVAGTGRFAANAKVKAVAAMLPGHAFAGWYDEAGELVSAAAAYSFVMPASGLTLSARSIALEDDFFELDGDDTVELALNQAVDTRPGAYFTVRSGSPFAFAASGLPTGVALKKIDAWTYGLTGKATRKGVYYATLVGKNNGAFKQSMVVKFVVGGATETLVNQTGIDLSDFECFDPYTGYDFDYRTEVPALNALGRPKSVTVKGLPTGLACKYPVAGAVFGEAQSTKSYLWISGIPRTPGLFTVTIAVTCTNGRVAKSVHRLVVRDSGSVYLPALVAEDCTRFGTVSGGGVKNYGATVKLVAQPVNKKLFFAGWWREADESESDGLVPAFAEWRNAVQTFVLGLDYCGEPIYGQFVTKAQDEISFVSNRCTWFVSRGVPCCCVPPNELHGFSNDLKPLVESMSLPTLKTSKLPAGIALKGSVLYVANEAKLQPGVYTVKLVAGNLSGNVAESVLTITVPNITSAVDNGRIKGLDTSDGYEFEAGVSQSFNLLQKLGASVASGWTLQSVTGLPAGWTYKKGVVSGVTAVTGPVTVTFVVARGKTTDKATATFNLRGLPDWMVGTFFGSVVVTDGKTSVPRECGVASVTVAANGKVSAAYVVRGDKTALTGSGFSGTAVCDGSMRTTLVGKVDGVKRAFTLTLRPYESSETTATLSGIASKNEVVSSELLVRNPWTRSDAASLELPVFAEGVRCSFAWTGYDYGAQNGTVVLTFGAKGVVKAAYVTNRGTTAATAQLADFSLEGEGGVWSGYLVVGIPPNKTKKISGVYCYVKFRMEADSDGLVHEVSVKDDESPEFAQVYSFGYAPFLW